MAAPIRVLIVEDHRVLAEGLAFALGQDPDLEVVGIAGAVGDAVRLAGEARPDVVLLDYHLAEGTGAEAATAIRHERPDAAAVLLTGDTSDAVLLDAVEAGACGVLLKSQALGDVGAAVRRAAAGEMLIPAATLMGVVGRLRDRQRQEQARARFQTSLTGREHEVLRLMAQGLDTRAIAERLVIGETTVRGYVQKILRSLDAHSRLEAVVRAGEEGLLD